MGERWREPDSHCRAWVAETEEGVLRTPPHRRPWRWRMRVRPGGARSYFLSKPLPPRSLGAEHRGALGWPFSPRALGVARRPSRLVTLSLARALEQGYWKRSGDELRESKGVQGPVLHSLTMELKRESVTDNWDFVSKFRSETDPCKFIFRN